MEELAKRLVARLEEIQLGYLGARGKEQELLLREVYNISIPLCEHVAMDYCSLKRDGELYVKELYDAMVARDLIDKDEVGENWVAPY